MAGYFVYRITKPLKDLEDNLAKFPAGKYNEIQIPPNTELSNAYNNLQKIAHKLQKYETKLTEQQEGFNIIVESIQDAIWIQDDKGTIISYNRSFMDLVGTDNIKSQYFWNVIRIKELYDFIDDIYQKPRSLTRELKLHGKYYICSASHSNFPDQTVFILSDITEIKQVEVMKKDFVLNVSHELRTPLTSIKGYLETLEDEIDDKLVDYLHVIKRNADRLINIVNDLLSLSRLEHESKLQKEIIDLENFMQNISNIFLHKIKGKKLDYKYEIAKDTGKLKADRFKLEQVIINLIDNAIKYTDSGYVKVLINGENDNVIFQVTDSGSGIDLDHLPRLFERFYVVDKSRSRKLGGTGLGLSIVKHIINSHNGTIEVESEPNKGTNFLISLPGRIK